MVAFGSLEGNDKYLLAQVPFRGISMNRSCSKPFLLVDVPGIELAKATSDLLSGLDYEP